MKVYDAASIRNVAIVGHTGCGKTQLASAMLADAGMVNRFGKVDEGTAPTDFDDEEIARKHTLSASLAYAEWNKTKINVIDTPGIGNFFADARAALQVADAALEPHHVEEQQAPHEQGDSQYGQILGVQGNPPSGGITPPTPNRAAAARRVQGARARSAARRTGT